MRFAASPRARFAVAGAIVTGARHGENLVRAMVTGEKRAAQPGDVD